MKQPLQFSLRTLLSMAVFVCVFAWWLAYVHRSYPNDDQLAIFLVAGVAAIAIGRLARWVTS